MIKRTAGRILGGLCGLMLAGVAVEVAQAGETAGIPPELVAEYTDIIQIGARNAQNFQLLIAAGAWFASRLPDGLQALAERLGLAGRAYSPVSGPVAGLAALALLGGVCAIAVRIRSRQRSA